MPKQVAFTVRSEDDRAVGRSMSLPSLETASTGFCASGPELAPDSLLRLPLLTNVRTASPSGHGKGSASGRGMRVRAAEDLK